jgi:hypothetical protein
LRVGEGLFPTRAGQLVSTLRPVGRFQLVLPPRHEHRFLPLHAAILLRWTRPEREKLRGRQARAL